MSMKPMVVFLIGGACLVDTPEKLQSAVECAACAAIGDFLMSGFRTEDLPRFADAIIGKLAENGDIDPEAIRAVAIGDKTEG